MTNITLEPETTAVTGDASHTIADTTNHDGAQPSIAPVPLSSLPSVKFSVPAADLDSFVCDLPPRARSIVQRRLKAMKIIHRAKLGGRSVWGACESLAAQFHMERGWSAKTIHALYLQYTRSGGDWRTLVDAAIAGRAWQNHLVVKVLPRPFLEWFASEVALNQRGKLSAAYSKLLVRLDKWRHGDDACAIPGYAEPPGAGSSRSASAEVGTDLPDGWTYSNLSVAVKPFLDKVAARLVRIGPKAASNMGPQIPGTRCGLAVGRYYLIDDSWNDFKVVAQGQTVRLLSFHILELFSGCNVARGYKPALRDEKDVEQRLKERELVWLLVKLLTTEGYHPSGCEIIGEKATACLRQRERDILATCGIPVTFNDGPAGGGAGIAAMFTGPGGGNPRWKAPLESWFNLLRNRTADLLEFPGQTGSNARLNCPEGLPGLERDTQALLKAAKMLPPEKAELLRLGMLQFHEAIFKADAITEVINCRYDHDLEGWRECGHYVDEFRVNAQMLWQPTAALLEYDPAERAAVAAVLNQVGRVTPCAPSLKRTRALSPREVFDAGKGDLIKLPLSVAALLIEDLEGTERLVQNNCLEVMVPEVDPDQPLQFGTARRDGQGTQTPLRNDEKYMVRVNPLDPRVAWLFDAKRKFAGVAQYYGRVRRDQPDQLKRAFGRKKAALAPLLEEAHRLAAPVLKAEAERNAHNARVLTDEGKEQEQLEDRSLDAFRKAASKF